MMAPMSSESRKATMSAPPCTRNPSSQRGLALRRTAGMAVPSVAIYDSTAATSPSMPRPTSSAGASGANSPVIRPS